jgi:sulfite reductase (NADPH) flavoprotein alpha-component
VGIMPKNDPTLVNALLVRLGAKWTDPAPDIDASIGDVLTSVYEIVTPSRDLVATLSDISHNCTGTSAQNQGVGRAYRQFEGKDVLDLLDIQPTRRLDPKIFIGLLGRLQHRSYSISSSPLAHPGDIHLTVATQRWQSEGRTRGGACSTYLVERLKVGEAIEFFVSPNTAFRLPPRPSSSMIMIGPGTGIAPFRGFLHHRRALGATGRNWLFFGDRHREHDFIYADELQDMNRDGLLTRLDLAFSRDQTQKLYVQHLMQENEREIFTWLQDGAFIYVCGDANHMARGVDQALHHIIARQGGIDLLP